MHAPHQELVGVPGLHCMRHAPQLGCHSHKHRQWHAHPSATAHRRAGSGGKGVWLLLAESGKRGGKHGGRHVRKQTRQAATVSAAAWMTATGPQPPARSTRSTGRGPWTRGRRSSPRGAPPPRTPPRTPTCHGRPSSPAATRHQHTHAANTPAHDTRAKRLLACTHTCMQKRTRRHYTRTCT